MGAHYSQKNLAWTIMLPRTRPKQPYYGRSQCTGVNPKTGENISRYHRWLRPGDKRLDGKFQKHCLYCKKTLAEILRENKPITLAKALEGN